MSVARKCVQGAEVFFVLFCFLADTHCEKPDSAAGGSSLQITAKGTVWLIVNFSHTDCSFIENIFKIIIYGCHKKYWSYDHSFKTYTNGIHEMFICSVCNINGLTIHLYHTLEENWKEVTVQNLYFLPLLVLASGGIIPKAHWDRPLSHFIPCDWSLTNLLSYHSESLSYLLVPHFSLDTSSVASESLH